MTSITQTHHQCSINSEAEGVPSPEMAPLVRPGMPWISVTLLRLKYSLQLALSSFPLQKSIQSFVVTVTLSIISVFMHLSKPWFCRVRLPNKQTLERTKERLERIQKTSCRFKSEFIVRRVVVIEKACEANTAADVCGSTKRTENCPMLIKSINRLCLVQIGNAVKHTVR